MKMNPRSNNLAVECSTRVKPFLSLLFTSRLLELLASFGMAVGTLLPPCVIHGPFIHLLLTAFEIRWRKRQSCLSGKGRH